MDTNPAVVTACIPYFKGKRYIRRAVMSMLAQTHRALDVVVVNDGDPDPPWDQLGDIRDPRLIRFNLLRNHGGPYFANAVVVNAISSPHFLMQEQDDWSEPERVARLLHLLTASGADVAISAQYYHQEDRNGVVRFIGVRWRCRATPDSRGSAGPRNRGELCVDTQLTEQFRYRAPHAGLFRVNALRNIGGYYAGLHLHYDSVLMNVLMMTGRICHTPMPLYHRLLQPSSLTHAVATKFGSKASVSEHMLVVAMYHRAFIEYRRYLAGTLTSERFAQTLRGLFGLYVSQTEKQELEDETCRLRALISRRRSLSL